MTSSCGNSFSSPAMYWFSMSLFSSVIILLCLFYRITCHRDTAKPPEVTTCHVLPVVPSRSPTMNHHNVYRTRNLAHKPNANVAVLSMWSRTTMANWESTLYWIQTLRWAEIRKPLNSARDQVDLRGHPARWGIDDTRLTYSNDIVMAVYSVLVTSHKTMACVPALDISKDNGLYIYTCH